MRQRMRFFIPIVFESFLNSENLWPMFAMNYSPQGSSEFGGTKDTVCYYSER